MARWSSATRCSFLSLSSSAALYASPALSSAVRASHVVAARSGMPADAEWLGHLRRLPPAPRSGPRNWHTWEPGLKDLVAVQADLGTDHARAKVRSVRRHSIHSPTCQTCPPWKWRPQRQSPRPGIFGTFRGAALAATSQFSMFAIRS